MYSRRPFDTPVEPVLWRNIDVVRLTLRCAVLLLCAVGCGGVRSSRPQAAAPDSPPVVTGRERVEWDQELLPDTAIGDYEFAVYVNDGRQPSRSVTCAPEAGIDGFLCSAPMPALSRGVNTLEFVAILDGVESERSDPLVVEITAPGPHPAASASRPLSETTIATGLHAPSDLALLPDGRVLIAERAGRVRVVAGGRLLDEPALTLDDAEVANGFGLFAIAAHPDFAATRFVYLAYTARLPTGRSSYRVVRAREVDHRLGEVATILESIPVGAPAWISARFGPDRKLYVGVAACAECRSPYAGTILRLNDDGSTPSDRASLSPVYFRDVRMPVGLAWSGQELWVADAGAGATSVVRTAQAGRVALPVPGTPAVILVRRGDAADGSVVLVSRPQGRGLQRFEPLSSPETRLAAAETLLPDSTTVYAAIEALDGSIYLCTSAGGVGPATLIHVTLR